MAETNVYYEGRQQQEELQPCKPVKLCFGCAVRSVFQSDLRIREVVLRSNDSEFNQCSLCGTFMSDRIII